MNLMILMQKDKLILSCIIRFRKIIFILICITKPFPAKWYSPVMFLDKMNYFTSLIVKSLLRDVYQPQLSQRRRLFYCLCQVQCFSLVKCNDISGIERIERAWDEGIIRFPLSVHENLDVRNTSCLKFVQNKRTHEYDFLPIHLHSN